MIQIIGIALIMAATTLAGAFYANRPLFRIKDLKSIKRALIILKCEIVYAQTELPIAMINIARRSEEPASFIFKDLGEGLKKIENGKGVSDIWEEALANNEKHSFMVKEDYEYLTSFGKTLGYLDTTMQTDNIEVAIKYIEDKVEELEGTAYKNKKMYQSLGVIFGALLVVILL